MISERRFVQGFTSFWDGSVPMMSAFVRAANLGYERYLRPMRSRVTPSYRAIVNEAAFRVYAAHIRDGCAISTGLLRESGYRPLDEARRFVSSLSESEGRHLVPANLRDRTLLLETVKLGLRHSVFLDRRAPATVWPSFPGCGLVDACSGDVLVEDTLVEVKAGERPFRAHDVRQVLTYAALNSASRKYPICKICLLNPRTGIYFECTVDELALPAAGVPPAELFARMVNFMSEPGVSR